MDAYHQVQGRAMGSKLQIIATGPADTAQLVLGRAQARVAELEARWSRFEPNSDVSRVNRAAGSAVPVSDDTLELVERALVARDLSGGRFDPLMLQAITASGYDRTFVSIDMATSSRSNPRRLVMGSAAVDRKRRTVVVSAGAGFDPGGIGKGLAADIVAAEMVASGADGALVNLGGDIRCVGRGPAAGNWVIEVGDVIAGAPSRIVELADGGVASSTCRRRRWHNPSIAGGEAHHLIDPQTGRPAEAAATFVTVIAASCGDAEWLATAIAAEGRMPADPHMLGAATVMLTCANGDVFEHGHIDQFVR